jgi:endo-1,4-beta-xylanase
MIRHLTLTAAAACALAAQTPAPALKDAFKGAFRIGAALNSGQFTERNITGAALVKRHFNAITPENVLKWERVHPEPDRYDFEAADAYVAFGEKNGMFIVGHTLVWHSQTPRWVFTDADGKPLTRDALLARMREHIFKVVGRYKGRVHGWDVVNEALNEDGTLRQSPWMRIIGPEYLAKAFEYAREADPAAELYYNDYSVENEAKRAGAVKLIRDLKVQGAKVAAIGLQGHNRMDWPTLEQQDATIRAFKELGIKVAITELDVDVLPRAIRAGTADVNSRVTADPKLNPYTDGLPEEIQRALAKRYSDLFGVYLRHKDVLNRVTFWGVTDRDSWLNGFPVRGRTNYPLLFDREYNPKPAFFAVVEVARYSPRNGSRRRARIAGSRRGCGSADPTHLPVVQVTCQ